MALKKWFNYIQQQQKIESQLESVLAKAGDEVTLDLNEFYLLYYLQEADKHELKQIDLPLKSQLSASAISRMLKRLENKNNGVIRREACEDDKRATYVVLTQKGLATFESLNKKIEAVLANYTDIL